MYRALKEKNALVSRKAINLAQTLVNTPSVSLDEQKAADIIAIEMKRAGFDNVIRDKAGNVVGIMFGRSASPTILLNSHMDTIAYVDGSAEHPYHGQIKDGKLYGVGTADCKGGLAAQLYSAILLKQCLLPLRGNLVFAATVAEENGASIGVRHLMDVTLPELEIKPDYAILGEPTGLGLYYGHDGWMEMEVKLEGADPFQVEDAAKAVIEDFRQEMDHEGEVEEFSLRRVRFETVNGLRRASFSLDQRLRNAEDASTILGRIRHEVKRAADGVGTVAVEVAVKQEAQKLYTGATTMVRRVANAWTTDPFHPLMERARQSLAAADCRVAPGKWKLGRLGMGTAGGVLVNEYSVPTIGFGPGLEEQAHSIGEYVELDKIETAIYGTAAIVHGLIGVPVFGWTSDEI